MFQSDIASVIGDAKKWSDIGKNHSAFVASEFAD
jgi:hypothetical protein